MLTPNRTGLKSVADFNVDASFVQLYGTQVFGYQGENTQEYEDLCNQLANVVSDALSDLQTIQSQIPTFSSMNQGNEP